jgi:WD40 repeat protein
VIDPDLETMEKKERRPDLQFDFITSREAAQNIVTQCSDIQSALRTGGKVVKTLTYGELKFPDDGTDDMKGDPIWIELQMGNQKFQTKVKGSQSSNWDEMFRFYMEPEDLETAVVVGRIFTTRTFGGKKLLGKVKIEMQALVPNTVTPMTLTPEENEHGMLVLQCKLTPHKGFTIPKKPGPYRKPILQELPALGLRERHITEDERAERRLLDLKAVLCIETNVFKDYPCWYVGLDSLGRVQLDGLETLGDRMADDIFACLKGYGALSSSLERPMDMLSLECAQHKAFQRQLGYVCTGRYETLLKAQTFVAETDSNRILIISGKAGTGKSNVMSCLVKMFTEGYRVVPNPHTKQLQLDPVAEYSKVPCGRSWSRPEVISIFMCASNGNTTPRYLLYVLMSQLAEILRDCRMRVEKSEHKVVVEPADPSALFPIPHEYNRLRLQFLTLCSNIDKFVPHKCVLIFIDQIDAVEAMRFDWLPVNMPKSFRIIISCGKSSVIKKMALAARSMRLELVQLQPFPMLARKEMVHHLLRQRGREIDMEQMDALVVHEGASMPDYLHIVIQQLAGFKKDMRLAMPVIVDFGDTTDLLTVQLLQRMEDYSGRNLVKRCLSFILMSIYGLTEYELRMLLAADSLSDKVLHRLPEEDEGTAVGYPNTSREARVKKLTQKQAMLPMSLWKTLSQTIKPFLLPSHDYQATKYQFFLKSFCNTIATRYGLENDETRMELHRKISAYYRARADPELQYSWRSTDYRAAQSLIYHHIGSHDWNGLTRVLTDVGFLEYCVDMGQVHGLCNDLKHAISALDSVGSREGANMKKMPELMQLSSFLGKNAQTLIDFPAVLLQSMANEPTYSSVHQIAMERIHGGWEGRNWLKRLRKEDVTSANTRTMRGHKGWIRALAVTLDSKYVVSGADDKSARFWSVDSGALIHLLTGHREAITAVDISSNGLYLITSSMDASVKLWDIRSGIELANLYVGSAATCCQFSHDATLILAGTLDSTLHLFDMRTFQELHVMSSHRLGIRSCIFSKDSTKILSAGSDAKVMLWEIASFTHGKKNIDAPNRVYAEHSNGVRALTWNPRNANQAISGSDDFNIIVWNLETGGITRKLVGHSAPVLSLCFTPSGAYVISSSHDSSLIVWDPNLDDVLFRFWGHMGPVYCVAISSDEYMAISAGADSTIRTWDLRGLLREDPDEPHILSKEMSTNLKDEKAPTKKARECIQYGNIYCLAFSPSGDVLLSGSHDSSYALRSIEDGEVIGEPRRGHAGAVYTCQWHPDGVRILTGSEDSIIKMWEASTGRLLRAFKGHEGPVYDCNFFPDGTQMMSVSEDHYIRIWDVETGKAVGKMPPHLGHLSAVRCCAISPENNVFCTGGDDNFVRVWVSLTLLSLFDIALEHNRLSEEVV